MMEHLHCWCFPVSWSIRHTGGTEIDERGKRKPIIRDEEVRDTMCCHCGAFKERKLRFVQTEGHGILRHCINPVRKEGQK